MSDESGTARAVRGDDGSGFHDCQRCGMARVRAPVCSACEVAMRYEDEIDALRAALTARDAEIATLRAERDEADRVAQRLARICDATSAALDAALGDGDDPRHDTLAEAVHEVALQRDAAVADLAREREAHARLVERLSDADVHTLWTLLESTIQSSEDSGVRRVCRAAQRVFKDLAALRGAP